ncbi:MAG: hypothetical protein N2Z65_04305, partial [Clostridiales bacterium]|nr:hypothetical protein [Clostridiales bacterium]
MANLSTQTKKSIDYDKDGDKCYQTELLLLDRKASEDTDGQEETEKAEEEAALVAMRIEEMLKTRFLVTDSETKEMRPVKPSDIVILLRSVTNKAKYFKNALAAKGIAASSNTEGG